MATTGLLRAAAVLLAAAFLCCNARGQVYFWNGSVNGNWNTAANWSSLPPSGQNTILFFSTANTTSLTNNISNPFQVNRLDFGANAGFYTIGGSALDFRTSGGGSLPEILVGTGSNITINANAIFTNNFRVAGGGIGNLNLNGSLSGPGSLTIDRLGNHILNSSSNSYSGGTVITMGTLILGHGRAIPAGTDVTVGPDGILNLSTVSNLSSDAIGTVTVHSGQIRVPSGSGNYSLNKLVLNNGEVNLTGADAHSLRFINAGAGINAGLGSVITGSSSARIINDTSAPLPINVSAGIFGGSLTLGSQLSSAGVNPNFVKLGNGSLVLNNSNNTASLQLDAGTVAFSNVAQLPTGTITLRNAESNARLLYDGSANATTSRNFVIGTGGGGFHVTPDHRVLTISGAISQAGASNIHILGNGKPEARSSVVFTNSSNAFTGAFRVTNDGILGLSSLANIGTAQPAGAAISPSDTHKFIIGDGVSAGALRLTGAASSYTTNYRLQLNSPSPDYRSAIDIANPGTNLTLTSGINNLGATPRFDKTGPGTLTFSGTGSNDSFFDVIVKEGTLAQGAAGNNIKGLVNIQPGGIFNTNGFSNFVQGSLSYAEFIIDGGMFRIPSGSATYHVASNTNNGRGLTMIGGTIELTGSTAPELYVGNPSALGTAGRFEVIGSSATAKIFGPAAAKVFIENELIVGKGNTPFGVDLDVFTSIMSFSGKYGLGTVRLNNPNAEHFLPVVEGTLRFDNIGVMDKPNPFIFLYGGKLQYGGPTAAFSNTPLLQYNSGGIDILQPGTTLTLGIDNIVGTGALNKTGPGTLSLTGSSPTAFGAGIHVHQGKLRVGTTLGLGGADNIIIHPGGTLEFTNTTQVSRLIQATTGTLAAAPGTTLQFFNSNVFGGYLVGKFANAPGGFTTIAGSVLPTSSELALSANAQITNVTNGGKITIAPLTFANFTNLTNTTSGRMTLDGVAIVSDFVNNGIVTIPGAATHGSSGGIISNSPIYSGGGGIITIGSQATPNGRITLNGNTLEVMGGLVVNNAIPNLFNPINAGILGGTTRVNFGSIAKGNGFYEAVETLNGGQYSPGNSPGLGLVGTFNFNGGGAYLFEINDALGTAGAEPGWDKTNVFTAINFTATPQDKFTINIKSLLPPSGDTPGPMANFDANQAYTWVMFEQMPSATLNGTFNPAAFNINTAQLVNPVNGTFSVEHHGQFINLMYMPIPEPKWFLLGSFVAVLFASARLNRRRSRWALLRHTLR